MGFDKSQYCSHNYEVDAVLMIMMIMMIMMMMVVVVVGAGDQQAAVFGGDRVHTGGQGVQPDLSYGGTPSLFTLNLHYYFTTTSLLPSLRC